MRPDPRHGTVAGYNRIPCRERCCKDAMAQYKVKRELDLMAGKSRIVPAIGTQRRVQALSCLGWSNAEVARRAGMHPEHLPRLVNHAETINRQTAARIAKVYDELSMKFPPSRTKQEKQAITYARNVARRKGWLPPLAWDDDYIDDPTYRPSIVAEENVRGKRQMVDETEVIRILDGQPPSRYTSPAEKREVVRRWDGSRNALARLTGWKVERYVDSKDTAA